MRFSVHTAKLAGPEMLADELFLLLEGARVTAQSIGREGLVVADLRRILSQSCPRRRGSASGALPDRKAVSLRHSAFPPLCTSARNGLGRRPVCDPVSVAEDLFTEVWCEFDHYRPTRCAEQ